MLKNYFVVVVLALPWLFPWLFVWKKIGEGNTFSLASIPINIGMIVYYYLLFFVPIIFLFFVPRIRKVMRGVDWGKDYLMYFAWFFILFVIIFKSVFNIILPVPEFRKMVVLSLFFNSVILAQIIFLLRKRVFIALVVLLLVTSNVLFVLPFMPIHLIKETDTITQYLKVNTAVVENFVNKSVQLRFYLFDYLYEITHEYVGPTEAVIKFINMNVSDGESIYISWDPYPVEYYTKRTVVERNVSIITAGNADWVIFGGSSRERYWINMREIDHDGRYELYSTINNNVEPWIGTPEIIHHRFSTKADGKIYVYRRQSSHDAFTK